MMQADKFRINPYQRFELVFWPLFLLGILVLHLWTLLMPIRGQSNWGIVLLPVILVLTAGAVFHLFCWFSFAVQLSDQGINISGTQLRWEDVESAHAGMATHFNSFSTLIELRSKDGRTYGIPACIQQSLFLLRKIQKHIQEIKKEQ